MKTKMTNMLYMIIALLGLLSLGNAIGINELQAKIAIMGETHKPPRQQIYDTSRKSLDQCLPEPILRDVSSQKFENSECDMITEGPICLFNGDRILLPFASPLGLVGYWNFDELRPLDLSGNKNHPIGIVKPGPAFGGIGSSAYFSGGSYLQVPYSSSFPQNDFTLTFWLFVVQDNYTSSKGIRYCPLIQRGQDDLFAKNYQRLPAIYYDRKDKQVKVSIKTANEDTPQGETLTSNARITSQRWLHVALQKKTDTNIKFYLNGILDSAIRLKAPLEINTSSLFIGNVPWLKEQCDFPFLIDELRYYNIPLDENYIQAEASPVLGGIEPSFLQLGCMNCSLKEASQSCVEGYRLCTSIELHTGGYQIARSMGWLSWDTHIWTHGALQTPNDFDKLQGLSLCCAELK